MKLFQVGATWQILVHHWRRVLHSSLPRSGTVSIFWCSGLGLMFCEKRGIYRVGADGLGAPKSVNDITPD